ncbi:MAG: hypothetical protein HY077_15230 [Elusimicrobia bacterium]|nr:hypothetical protein [Elusimicrobiota bacterium]
MRNLGLIVFALAAGACTSVGQLGLVTKSAVDPAAILRSGRQFKEIGPAEGRACRHFVLGVLPWGNADIQAAVDEALKASGGDALVNATTSNSHYGFIPFYNLYSFTCTAVKGTAIKFQ